jgi:hypothetical protein
LGISQAIWYVRDNFFGSLVTIKYMCFWGRGGSRGTPFFHNPSFQQEQIQPRLANKRDSSTIALFLELNKEMRVQKNHQLATKIAGFKSNECLCQERYGKPA